MAADVSEMARGLSGASADVRRSWVQGLPRNASAPGSVLLRILALDPLPGAGEWLVQRELPAEVAMAALHHPDSGVRRSVLENRSLPPELFATRAFDADARVRRACVVLACDMGVELPEDALQALAADGSAKIRYWTAACPNLPFALRRRLADDPDPEVRAASLTPELWSHLRNVDQERFRADPHAWISEAVRRVSGEEKPLPCSVRDYLDEVDASRRRRAAAQAAVDRELAELLVSDSDPYIRASAAGNSHVPTETALALVHDPDDEVRLQISLREDINEEQRSAISYTVPQGRREPVGWVREKYSDAEAMRAAASSSHVLLRRSVAAARHLPDDVVGLLAHDEDYFVRLTLCECCDEAPHDLLVEMYSDWVGLRWSFLTLRPNFARAGLARFARSSVDRLRYAALFDPQITPALVEQLTHDESQMVRVRAITDHRLPIDRLLALLVENGTSMAAAMNPALSTDLMHLLLDLAGTAPG